MTVPQPSLSYNDPKFHVALATTLAAARRAYPHIKDQQRLAKAKWLVLSGAVELYDGSAIVASQSQKGHCYRVQGRTCTCDDVMALDRKCKHRWSVCLLRRTLATMATLPAPSFWQAEFQPIGGGRVRGIAQDWGADWYFFTPTGETVGRWVDATVTILGDAR